MTETCASKIIAGEAAVIARRYATALLGLAEEKKQLDAVEADMRLVRDLLDTNPDFQRLVSGAGLSPDAQRAVMKKLVDSGQFSDVVAKFLALLAQKQRLNLLCPIVTFFKADRARQQGQYTAEVTTARALSPTQIQTLSTELGRQLGGSVDVVVKEDVSLLGGLTVKLGSHLVDASIKGKLAQLEKKLKSQQEAA